MIIADKKAIEKQTKHALAKLTDKMVELSFYRTTAMNTNRGDRLSKEHPLVVFADQELRVYEELLKKFAAAQEDVPNDSTLLLLIMSAYHFTTLDGCLAHGFKTGFFRKWADKNQPSKLGFGEDSLTRIMLEVVLPVLQLENIPIECMKDYSSFIHRVYLAYTRFRLALVDCETYNESTEAQELVAKIRNPSPKDLVRLFENVNLLHKEGLLNVSFEADKTGIS